MKNGISLALYLSEAKNRRAALLSSSLHDIKTTLANQAIFYPNWPSLMEKKV